MSGAVPSTPGAGYRLRKREDGLENEPRGQTPRRQKDRQRNAPGAALLSPLRREKRGGRAMSVRPAIILHPSHTRRSWHDKRTSANTCMKRQLPAIKKGRHPKGTGLVSPNHPKTARRDYIALTALAELTSASSIASSLRSPSASRASAWLLRVAASAPVALAAAASRFSAAFS